MAKTPTSFLERLQQRRVVRVASVYIITSWLILQVVAVVFPILEMPLWSQRIVLWVALAGFPVVVIMAWVKGKISRNKSSATEPALSGKKENAAKIPDNLPKSLTSFLGREKEISELKALLSNHRLITLTGPGGTGKTRLAIELARKTKEDFTDGIYWVSLVTTREKEAVPFDIAKQLGLKEDPLLSIEQVLYRFFQHKQALLILDNFEQVVEAADLVHLLIQNAEKLKIIVSSRIVLQINGEIEYSVSPLEVPKLNGSIRLEQLQAVPSVALFEERAQMSSRNFALTEKNIEAVAEICLRLDGLPLAIELAAARTKIFTPKALLHRLNNRVDELKVVGKFPARQQTLRQTITWSYDLLEEEEKDLFRRASVFIGGSTMEAIEKVCGRDGFMEGSLPEGVMALVDKSLLQTRDQEDEIRFYMLETIREFALEALNESGEIATYQRAHIDHYLQLIENAAPQLSGSKGDQLNKTLFLEQPNFSAAINYSLQLQEIGLAYRMGLALRRFWGSRGMTREGVEQLEKLVAVPINDTLREERLQVLQALGMLYMYIPTFEKAILIFEECLNYWEKQKDLKRIGLAKNDLGYTYILFGKLRKGELLSREAGHFFENTSDHVPLLASLNNLGFAYQLRGKPGEALKYFIQILDLAEQLGDLRRHAYALANMGYSYYQLGNYDEAEKHLQESMVIPRKISDKLMLGHGLRFLGFVKYATSALSDLSLLGTETEKIGKETSSNFFIAGAFELKAMSATAKGDLREATQWIDKAAEIWKVSPVSHFYRRVIYFQANLSLLRGVVDKAMGSCSELLDVDLEEGDAYSLICGFEIAARIGALQDQYIPALQLYANAQMLRKELNTPIVKIERPIYEELEKKLKNELSEKRFELIKNEWIDQIKLLELARSVIGE